MKKNLIFRLFLPMVLFTLFHSCIHDETLASSDPASKEYTNKSLWKEDEKYIMNVMKIYQDNELKIKKSNGTPYWNYATTVDQYDESFLMVPVVENGKVVSVLQVPRHQNKVYFVYTFSKPDLLFFQNLLSSRLKKTMKTMSDETGKLTCSTLTYSVWHPDSESNSDPSSGSGHWETYHVTRCSFSQITECVGIVGPDGECNEGGGGYDYPTGGGTGNNPPDPPNPCTKAIESNTKAKEILNKAKVTIAKNQITSTLSTDTNEKSFSYGKDSSGNYDTTPIKTATAGNQVGLQANNPNLSIEGGAHTHTVDLYNCFSAGDIYSLQGANTINSNFTTFFVFANGGIGYALTIIDPVKYANFVANYSAGSNLDMSTSNWQTTSPIYVSFDSAMKQFMYQGYSQDDAMANATALVLSKYDVGATLSQSDSSGNFNSIFVEENVNNVNVGGVPLPITTYKKTSDCNLK
jgi:hypothetical protein